MSAAGEVTAWLHCGQLLHGAATVTAGVRMVLVGFVSEVVVRDDE